jgi:hypothetical protein
VIRWSAASTSLAAFRWTRSPTSVTVTGRPARPVRLACPALYPTSPRPPAGRGRRPAPPDRAAVRPCGRPRR